VEEAPAAPTESEAGEAAVEQPAEEASEPAPEQGSEPEATA
jgi:hypothetical protein